MTSDRAARCLSGDGRHSLCQANNCNPNFSNPDGSTYTVPCKWEESVTRPAVPCYWEAVVPPGRRICAEGDLPALEAAAAIPMSPRLPRQWTRPGRRRAPPPALPPEVVK